MKETSTVLLGSQCVCVCLIDVSVLLRYLSIVICRNSCPRKFEFISLGTRYDKASGRSGNMCVVP